MYVCMYVCMYVRMYVYMYVCMYVCMYIHTHTVITQAIYRELTSTSHAVILALCMHAMILQSRGFFVMHLLMQMVSAFIHLAQYNFFGASCLT